MPDKVEADSIGARVKELRDKRGLNRAQLAQLTERSVQAIWMIETGRTLNPKMDTIRALAKALRTSVTALLK